MAKREEEVVLKLDIDQQGAETDLKKIEKVILDNRKAMADLNAAYRKGTIDQEEYIEENLRLQRNMKAEQDQKKTLIKLMETESNSRNAMRIKIAALVKEYDNLNKKTVEGKKRADELQKELKELTTAFNESSKAAGLFKDNIGRYAESIKEAAKDIQFAGVSVGNLMNTLKAFASPAGAAAAAVTALGAAYLRSAAGARDFQRAQDNIQASIDLFSNRVGNATGGGFLARASRNIGNAIANLTTNTKAEADEIKMRQRIAAIELQTIRELEVEQIKANEAFKKREREAEQFRNIRDDAEQSYINRLAAAQMVEQALNGSGEERIKIIRQQVAALTSYAENVGAIVNGEVTSLELQKQLAQYAAEISDIEEDITGKKSENLAATRSLTKEMAEQARLQGIMNENARRTSRDRPLLGTNDKGAPTPGGVRRVGDEAIDRMGIDPEAFEMEQQIAAARIQLSNDVTAKIQANEESLMAYRKEVNKVYLQGIGEAAGMAATLFEEQTAAYQIFASAQTAISAWTASQKVFESYAGLGPAGVAIGNVQRVLALAQGLAAVLEINKVGFADGGFTGPGFGMPDRTGFKPAGTVHEGEYVVPKHIVESPAGMANISALENMRRRPYADGGFVTNQATMPSNTALASASMMQNLPAPELDVSEVTRMQNRIKLREKISQMNNRKKG